MRRQRILERVGWKFWRVFGSSYALNPDAVFDDLLRTLEAQGIMPANAMATASKWTEHKIIEPKEVDIQTAPGGTPNSSNGGSDDSETITYKKDTALKVGDRIVLHYIDQLNARPTLFVVEDGESILKMGRLSVHSPLAKELAEIEIGEEFIFRTEGTEQNILFVAKQSSDDLPIAAE